MCKLELAAPTSTPFSCDRTSERGSASERAAYANIMYSTDVMNHRWCVAVNSSSSVCVCVCVKGCLVLLKSSEVLQQTPRLGGSGRKIKQSRPKGISTPAQRQQLKTLYRIFNQTLTDPVYAHKLTVQLSFPVVLQQGHVNSCFSSFWRFSCLIQSIICERIVKNTYHNLNWKLEMSVWKITETMNRLSK